MLKEANQAEMEAKRLREFLATAIAGYREKYLGLPLSELYGEIEEGLKGLPGSKGVHP